MNYQKSFEILSFFFFSLNCALLNTSFTFSPSKEIDAETPVKIPPALIEKSVINCENNKNLGNQNVEHNMDSGFLSGVANINILKTQEKPKIAIHLSKIEEPLELPYRPIKSRLQLFPSKSTALTDKKVTPQEKKGLSIFSHLRTNSNSPTLPRKEDFSTNTNFSSASKELPSVFQKSRASLQRSKTLDHPDEASVKKANSRNNYSLDVKIPETILKTSPEKHSAPIAQTPFKNNESVMFVTPLVKSLREFSTQKKCQMTNPITGDKVDFRQHQEASSQKILFTTPIGLPRPPILSLDTTPSNELMKPPVTNRKLSPISEIKKSIKASESLYSAVDKEQETPQRILTVNKNEFIVDKKIGSGGSSTVFLARSKRNGRECAIKLVNLDGDQAVVDGYLNETKLLAKLQGNINVVALYDYVHIPEKNQLIMVMEKGDSDLHKVLQSFKTDIPLYMLMNFWYQILQSVNYIHQNGVIHSDLKPANFLMINGRLKLIDFGIASNIAIDSTSIIKFSQAGTFNYISPEALIDTSSGNSPVKQDQYQPKIKISTKSDVWSLGCILYLFLYKKTPFSHIKQLYTKVNAITNPNTDIEYPKLPNYYPPMLLEVCLLNNLLYIFKIIIFSFISDVKSVP